jgi:hypothetical protein
MVSQALLILASSQKRHLSPEFGTAGLPILVFEKMQGKRSQKPLQSFGMAAKEAQ